MANFYSIIVTVYNRPYELNDFLESIKSQKGRVSNFEVIIVEDGSSNKSFSVVERFKPHFNLFYFEKENSGPGLSRNYGCEQSKGNYFLFIDSDCILPEDYLESVDKFLFKNPVDCFGGRDTLSKKFSFFEKSVDFLMTSFSTTFGFRKHIKSLRKYEPKSYNMGISRDVYKKTKGFAAVKCAEDTELLKRIRKKKFSIAYIKDAYVYHRRKRNISLYTKQMYSFGYGRGIVNYLHPSSKSLFFYFPLGFSIFSILSILLAFFKLNFGLNVLLFYLLLMAIECLVISKKKLVVFLIIPLVFIQNFYYAYGFLKLKILLLVSKNKNKILYM